MTVKFLIIRFSSIGDIVLTSPLVRILKQQVKGAEIHYLTKENFAFISKNNPYIDKTIAFDGNWNKMIKDLEQESYDHIIDLHNNIRTQRIKKHLAIPSFTFDKLNVKKWIYENFPEPYNSFGNGSAMRSSSVGWLLMMKRLYSMKQRKVRKVRK